MPRADSQLGREVTARARQRLRRLRAPESPLGKRAALAGLLLLTVLLVALNDIVGSVAVPPLFLVVPIVLGGLLLASRPLLILLVVAFAALIVEDIGFETTDVHPGAYVVMGIVAGIALELARDRERLGISAGRGEQMLLELRDRLVQQGRPPELPSGWHIEVVQASAGGASFGGDFMVSTLTRDGRGLEFALIDVSGKGVDAGSRALMLSGALGGLLGAVPVSEFLPAANNFLLRQEWGEGFATGMHLVLDLTAGHFRLANAGHPPAVHYSRGAGRWELIGPRGTVLGLLGDAEFGAIEGELRPGDAFLLYTDGMVEVPGRDLSVGIDRLLGGAERLLPHGFSGGAQRLLEDVAPAAADDRALALLWRD